MPTTAYVFAEEYLTTTDSAVRSPLSLTRSAAETVTPTDGPSSSVTAPRSVNETVTPTDAVASFVALARPVAETVTPGDAVGSVVRFARSAQEPLSQADATARAQSLHRGASEAPAAPGDAVGRALRYQRSVREAAEVTSSANRTTRIGRSASETSTVADLAQRGFVWRASAGDTVTPSDDAQGDIVTLVVPHLVSLTVTPESVSLDQSATVAFAFSVPVTAWVVRVGATCPFDGTLLGHYEGPAVFAGSVQVTGRDLGIYGASEIQVYGMSHQGFWSSLSVLD